MEADAFGPVDLSDRGQLRPDRAPASIQIEERISREDPTAITHPEYCYGFLAVSVAWQVAFFLIATNSLRYRPLMIPAVLEKTASSLAAAVLFAHGRTSGRLLAFGIIDLLLGLFFLAAYSLAYPVVLMGALCSDSACFAEEGAQGRGDAGVAATDPPPGGRVAPEFLRGPPAGH